MSVCFPFPFGLIRSFSHSGVFLRRDAYERFKPGFQLFYYWDFIIINDADRGFWITVVSINQLRNRITQLISTLACVTTIFTVLNQFIERKRKIFKTIYENQCFHIPKQSMFVHCWVRLGSKYCSSLCIVTLEGQQCGKGYCTKCMQMVTHFK